MSSRTINYICCPNGFGHFARFAILNKILEKKKIRVNLYTNKKAWIKFTNFNNYTFSNIKLLNHNLPTYNKDKNETLKFFKKMSSTFDDNIIISDNYEEICFFKKNVILIANFFWNISFRNKLYLKKLDLNIIKNKCIVFGNIYFAAEYVKKNPNFYGIGFFGKKKITKKSQDNKILFVKGFGSFQDNFEKQLLKLYEINKNKYNIILDANICFAKKYNLKPIKKFDEKLFSELSLVVGRPSFGILTDAFARNIPFLPLSDLNDLESIETKKQINDIFGKTNNIEKYISSANSIYKNHSFLFNGEKELINLILDII